MPIIRHTNFWLSCGLAAMSLAQLCGCSNRSGQSIQPATLGELLETATNKVAGIDVVRMNLLCAENLQGKDAVRLTNSFAELDEWAARVKSETERHNYRYERNPAEFENSKGFFKMLMLGVVLVEDFKVHYRLDRRGGPETASMRDGFFADANDVFLTGLLGEQRQGTCSSMPVLYVAVGRRLGYPLKLVTTKGHLFVRWEGEGERFNLEVTGKGLSRFSDDYYRHWPFEVSASELRAERYLESLSPAGELAVFLSIRAMCLREAGRMSEAADAFAEAAKHAPEVASYRMMERKCRDVVESRSLNLTKESL